MMFRITLLLAGLLIASCSLVASLDDIDTVDADDQGDDDTGTDTFDKPDVDAITETECDDHDDCPEGAICPKLLAQVESKSFCYFDCSGRPKACDGADRSECTNVDVDTSICLAPVTVHGSFTYLLQDGYSINTSLRFEAPGINPIVFEEMYMEAEYGEVYVEIYTFLDDGRYLQITLEKEIAGLPSGDVKIGGVFTETEYGDAPADTTWTTRAFFPEESCTIEIAEINALRIKGEIHCPKGRSYKAELKAGPF
jgi:hypothetical protein